jgi:hypothetical protein
MKSMGVTLATVAGVAWHAVLISKARKMERAYIAGRDRMIETQISPAQDQGRFTNTLLGQKGARQ